MLISKILVFLLATVFVIPLTSYAQVTAEIEYPYYRSEKREIREESNGSKNLWPVKEYRTEEKVGKSLFFSFFVRHTLKDLRFSAPFNTILASEKISKENETLQSPKFVDVYHIKECTTDHTFKSYNNPSRYADVSKDKIDAKIRTKCKGARGYDGYDSGNHIVYNAPEVDQTTTRGESTIKYKVDDTTYTSSIREDSKAILTLSAPPENLCIKFARFLVDACARGAVSTLVPGGFIINQSGATSKITGELENAIFKNNPTWTIPIKVSAVSLTPRVNSNNIVVYEPTPVSCSQIKVLGKKLDQNCITKVSMREKTKEKDITPAVDSAKYYSYNITIAGSPVQTPYNVFTMISESLFAAVYQVEEGKVVLDSEGFLVVPDDNVEYLPLTRESDNDTVTYDLCITFSPDAPCITSISKNSTKIGDTVTITGKNFNGVDEDSVYLETTSGAAYNGVVSSVSPTQIVFSIPPMRSGDYELYLVGQYDNSNKVSISVN